jgi:hypothetical protein
MIEFKGAYFNKVTNESKTVLVQFDGVLLHVWQMADPFCRLLSSDVFFLHTSIGKGKRYIKLPNGGKIVTEDTNALASLCASYRCRFGAGNPPLLSKRNALWIACGLSILAGAYILINNLFFS